VRAAAAGVDRRAMAVLSTGHMFTDIAQGSIPALLPFLIADRHISIAAASALVLAATISSSVIQPLFGHVSDRVSLPWLMPLGPALGGLGVALVGFAPTYPLTFAAVLLSGLGVAAFHPEGSRFANYVSGARRASGMSRFSVGGNIGFALGPVMVTPLLIAFGLHGTAFVLIPTWIAAAVLFAELPRLKVFRRDVVGGRVQKGEHSEAWGPFVILAGVIALRSFVYFGLVTFIPLYYVNVLHTSKALGNTALTVMLLGGAAGTLLGGPLADRFGRRTVLVASMCVIPPLVAAFLLSGPVLGLVFAGLAGAATIATFAVTIVMGQEYLPDRLGVAAGVTIGLSIGLGGVGAPLLGVLADSAGLRAVFETVAVLPLAALALSLALPRRTPREGVASAPRPSGGTAARRRAAVPAAPTASAAARASQPRS
jgi:MFS transporter, FSR family, fosmidomycin resistance protein